MQFEQGPIRPPSEATSLLLRVTRNCPWNKCVFCKSYKKRKFSRRSVEEIKNDIMAIKNTCEEIKDLSKQWGERGNISLNVIQQLQHKYDHTYLHLAIWLYYGGKTAFLQDANSLILKKEDLLEVLQTLKDNFPSIERITTYARAKTVCKKNVQELEQLHQAGLTRVHMGLESGSDKVLSLINKGATSSEMIEAGQKLIQGGLSLSYYIILGMGGKKYTQEHALESARVINAANPDYIRFRTLSVIPRTQLADMVEEGIFEPLPEEEIAREEKLLIENIDHVNSNLASDHANNLLEDVRGKLPEEKKSMLQVIDRFLQMPLEDRTNFQLGKRLGIYRTLDDMKDPTKYNHVSQEVKHLQGEGSFENVINYIRQRL